MASVVADSCDKSNVFLGEMPSHGEAQRFKYPVLAFAWSGFLNRKRISCIMGF